MDEPHLLLSSARRLVDLGGTLSTYIRLLIPRMDNGYDIAVKIGAPLWNEVVFAINIRL